MRLFIAVYFDQQTKSKITQAADRLKSMGLSGNYTKEQNYHLTLLFLGESDARQLQAAKRAIQELKAEPFDITFQNISNFSKNIIHLKAAPSQQLNDMHRFLCERLKNDFALREPNFSPHVTLVRQPNFIPNAKKEDFKDILPIVYRADNVTLMLSSRENGALVYAPLFVRKL